ncbi:snRNA-activating protein complex subunit 3 [Ictidomys tridecemlineatus]|uniref:snRNA-activating protein complex subunit 3 n=1 Tax=Ictidomys tridecemlineatus TaxID=43179 RepID=I3LZX9_ICTTR|nr:snRNA-activating protein complex subunit 3 isoform X1 [Ictidomys tridecemlineatus]KAG3287286.1 small nuclear RNA activating complex polypeptide 3 [Ictidomys tridecemlineatus]
MAEDCSAVPTCSGMGGRQDPVPSPGGCNFPEYELPELNTRAFHVGAFGELWRGRLRGAGDLSLREPPASSLPGSWGSADSDLEDSAVARDLGCSLEAAAELRMVCSLDKLKCLEEGEDPEVIPENTDLVTLGVRKRFLEHREETITIDRVCRQETFAYEMESHAMGKKPKNSADMIEEGELILSVNILYPVIFHKHKEHKPYQTMQVLGSQKLTELRDSICCVSDLQIGGEFSNTPDQAPEHISKDLYKSAFFYFEGTFYNDKRYPECRDLSRTIIEWSESHDRGYGKFQTARMEDFTFNDLNIKLGFPYLYCHQGDCEHVVVITDIRLVHYDDCLDRTLYPLLTKKHWLWTRKCFVCKMYTARWVTNSDSFAPEDPCFFCDVCFRMLHYDSEGNKLGEFLAYPYVDPGTFN